MLTCVLESSPPAMVLRLHGVLDLDGAVRVRAALHKALAAQPSAIVVDLAAVRVHDEIMLAVFAAFARTAAAWPGCAVLVCGPDQALTAAMGRTVAGCLLPAYADRTQALDAATLLPAPYRF